MPANDRVKNAAVKPDIHQYIERKTGKVKTEQLLGDRMVCLMYSTFRENAGFLFNRLISSRASAALGYLNYDCPVKSMILTCFRQPQVRGVCTEEIYGRMENLDTCRKVFERQIQYWIYRPMTTDMSAVVSPSDARMLMGSFSIEHTLLIKEKFFSYHELIGNDRGQWADTFEKGDYAVFRLTPEKYHYNHAPVSGIGKRDTGRPGRHD